MKDNIVMAGRESDIQKVANKLGHRNMTSMRHWPNMGHFEWLFNGGKKQVILWIPDQAMYTPHIIRAESIHLIVSPINAKL